MAASTGAEHINEITYSISDGLQHMKTPSKRSADSKQQMSTAHLPRLPEPHTAALAASKL
jgi:hypothetical protein